MKQLTSRQLANHAKMILDKYLNTGDLQHLKDAKLLIPKRKLKTSQIANSWK